MEQLSAKDMKKSVGSVSGAYEIFLQIFGKNNSIMKILLNYPHNLSGKGFQNIKV